MTPTKYPLGIGFEPMTQEPLPMELPPKAVVPNRPRTNENWQRDDPETYEAVVADILELETCQHRLAQKYAPLRKLPDGAKGVAVDTMRRAIGVLIATDPRLGREKYEGLIKMKLTLAKGTLVETVSDLGGRVKDPKLLGAAAMALKMVQDTEYGGGAAPSVVIRHEHSVTITTETQQRREAIAEKLRAARQSVVVDVEEETQA